MNQAIYSIEGLDISGTKNEVDNSMIVLEEYKKMLRLEKSRRRFKDQINKTSETKTMKEDLKKNCQQRNLATNPYNKKETNEEDMN